MPAFSFPIKWRTLYASGDVLLWAQLDLLLKDSAGNWQHKTFLVDPGTEMTTVPAAIANKYGLPLPQQPIVGAVISPTNLPFRSGLLRARILGTDTTEYVIPCFFLGDPAGPVPVNQLGKPLPNLLGLTGVINQLRLTFDGDPSPTAPYGHLIVEKK